MCCFPRCVIAAYVLPRRLVFYFCWSLYSATLGSFRRKKNPVSFQAPSGAACMLLT